MTYSYYNRLTKAQQKIACKIDSLVPITLTELSALKELIAELQQQLSLENVQLVARSCQQLRFSGVRVHMLEKRRHDDYSELHGLYEPVELTRACAKIYV